jgi:nucleoid-associated protein YgaU
MSIYIYNDINETKSRDHRVSRDNASRSRSSAGTINILSKIKIIMLMLVITVITVAAGNFILSGNNANGQTHQKYISVEVSAGDTLWDIADTYLGEEMDTRQAVHIIRTANDMDTGLVTPGQMIRIPVDN